MKPKSLAPLLCATAIIASGDMLTLRKVEERIERPEPEPLPDELPMLPIRYYRAISSSFMFDPVRDYFRRAATGRRSKQEKAARRLKRKNRKRK